MDRELSDAMRQREWEDCYKQDYCPYYMNFDEEEEEDKKWETRDT